MPVGISFYGILFLIWHIPTIAVEFGVCCYMGFNQAFFKI